jgi:hypothetical protein
MSFIVGNRVTRIAGSSDPDFRATLNKSGKIIHIVAKTVSGGWTIPTLYYIQFDNGYNQAATEDQLILEGSIRPPVRPKAPALIPLSVYDDDDDDDDDDLPDVIKAGENVIIDGTRPAVISFRRLNKNYDVRYIDNLSPSVDYDVVASRITRGLRKKKSHHTTHMTHTTRTTSSSSRGPYVGQRVRYGPQEGQIIRIGLGDWIDIRYTNSGNIQTVNIGDSYLTLL